MSGKLKRDDRVIIELKPLEIWDGTVVFNNDKYIEICYCKQEDYVQITNLTFSKAAIVSISRIVNEKGDRSIVETATNSPLPINGVKKKEINETLVNNNTETTVNDRVEPGDIIVIRTKEGETFKGRLEQVLKISLELSNVTCQETGAEIDMLAFKNHEIQSIKIVQKTETLPKTSIPTNEIAKKIKIPQNEFERLRKMTTEFIYLKKNDKDLSDAFYDLDNSETIGIAALGSTFNKMKPLSLILMCNFKTVYIFDVACLKVTQEIKQLLEADYIMKVAHDITSISYYFHHNFNLKINNVFDTQIADSWLTEKSTGESLTRDLSECLAHHFNFPPSIVSAALDEMDDCNWDKSQRPFSRKSGKLNRAAQLVVYLLILKEHLMKLMLKDYFKAVDKEISKACETNSFQMI